MAEELVQESWLRWSGRGCREEFSRPLLKRIVRNLAFDWLRRQRVERTWLSASQLVPGTSPDPEAQVVARQDIVCAAAALAELPERTRRAFHLSRVDSRTFAEIGRDLGVSTPRAHQLVRQALLHIAARLEP